VNTIFKFINFEKFLVDMVFYVNDILGKKSDDEFIRKALMYISFIDNLEFKSKLLRDLKSKLADFDALMTSYNVSIN